MARRGSALLRVVCVALAVVCVAAPTLHAQNILKRIKDQAAKRVADGRAKADSTLLRTTGTVVDSAVTKSNRGADAVAGKVTEVANGALEATERGVKGVVGGADPARDLAARLASGRLVLDELRFDAGSDQLDAASEATLHRVAAALTAATGAFLIEGHTGADADAQALSQKRATAVKARLVAAGVPAERLVAVGYGATRPTVAGQPPSARIEIVRAQ